MKPIELWILSLDTFREHMERIMGSVMFGRTVFHINLNETFRLEENRSVSTINDMFIVPSVVWDDMKRELRDLQEKVKRLEGVNNREKVNGDGNGMNDAELYSFYMGGLKYTVKSSVYKEVKDYLESLK